MNILFILEERVNTGIDGHAIYLLNLCKEIIKRGHSVYIIYNKKNKFYDLLRHNKMNVKIIDMESKNIKKMLNIFYVNNIKKLIKKFILDKKIKYIHCSFIGNLNFLSKKWGVPISCNHHGSLKNERTDILYFLKKYTAKDYLKFFLTNKLLHSYNKARYIVCSGERAKETVLKKYKVKKEKILKFFNTANLDLTNLNNIRGEFKIKDNDILILGVGRIQYDKGVEDFCEIAKMFREFTNFKFLYAGPEKNNIYKKEILNKYDKYVTFLGARNDINNLLFSSDIFLMLSHRESFPQIVLEAMSVPTITITWNVVGCDEVIINQNNGISCKFRNFNEVKMQILNILNNKLLSNSINKNAKNFSNKYTIDRLADLYLEKIFI